MSDLAAVPRPESLLGVVFAGADMVFEVDDRGVIDFALGAVESMTGLAAAALRGRPWSILFSEQDQDLLAALVGGLGPGERLGPLQVALAAEAGRAARQASLSVFRLPRKAGSPLSCALSLGGPVTASALAAPSGLVSKDSFDDMAADLLSQADKEGLSIRLDLVEMNGLQATTSTLGQDGGEVLRRQIAAALRADSYGGLGAAEVAPDRFAVLRNAAASSARLTSRLKTIVGDSLEPATIPLPLQAASPAQNLRAMRYALDRYIEDGAQAAAKGFASVVRRTVDESARFRSMLSGHAFQLVYQPVVTLGPETLHHYEALARFGGDSSPADTIRLAEELGLITDFDLSVVQTVADVLASAASDVAIAANLSAVSLLQPSFPEALMALTAARSDLRPRLLLEITETQALRDLPMANRIIQSLRGLGHPVCLDDFGAGAASLEYLRCLDVDFVKIDGRYIQSLTGGSRDEMILKHVVALCRDIGVSTIAEMMETPESGRLALALGVNFGQGWLFGKPTAQIGYRPAMAAPPAKRSEAVEQWS